MSMDDHILLQFLNMHNVVELLLNARQSVHVYNQLLKPLINLEDRVFQNTDLHW